ncbi:MAG: hypothetical protein K0U47_07260 [Epsilonproteobacteria bacterium]|nr:hypothetical protein [Campylobacterota bacterium]
MKIAIPVKMNKENTAVAPLFGKAKWFAFVEDGSVEIRKSEMGGGHAVIEWFIAEQVDVIIMQEMGMSPYQMIKTHGGIKIYHSGFERILLNQVLQKFYNRELALLDEVKMQEIITHHEGKHTHGDHQHKETGDHNGHHHHC